MTIKTKYGTFTDIDHIKPYGHSTYTLGFMPDYEDASSYTGTDDTNGNEEPYALLGFDAPISDDPNWRFWVEFGDKKGYAETYDAELSQSDIDKIIGLYEREKGVIVTDYYTE